MRKLTEKHIILASHNKGKLKEIADLLNPFGIKVTSAGDLGLNEPDETENTYVGNARIKAHYAAKSSNKPEHNKKSDALILNNLFISNV